MRTRAISALVLSFFVLAFAAPSAHANYFRLFESQRDGKKNIYVGNHVQGVRRVPNTNPYSFFGRDVLRPSVPALFLDVPENHPNYDAIRYVASQGIMDGIGNNEFGPHLPVSRSEFTWVVAERVFSPEYIDECLSNISFPYPAEYSLLFSDLPKEGEEAKRICAALMAGVVHGYNDGTYRKDDPIQFAEAAKIVARAYDTSFLPHRGYGVEWFKLYVTGLAKNAGIPVSVEQFDSMVTRAEAAEMLYRADAGITNRPSKTYEDLMAFVGGVVRSVVEWFM